MDNQIILIPVPLTELITGLTKSLDELIQAKFENLHEGNGSKNSPLYQKPVTEKELCAYFRISAPTAIRWRKKGKIPFIMIGSAIRYNLAEVERALIAKKK